MKVLLDSSTLIAAMLPDHVHHQPAHAWLAQAKLGAFVGSQQRRNPENAPTAIGPAKAQHP